MFQRNLYDFFACRAEQGGASGEDNKDLSHNRELSHTSTGVGQSSQPSNAQAPYTNESVADGALSYISICDLTLAIQPPCSHPEAASVSASIMMNT